MLETMLFVDDDVNLLEGLQRMLRPRRSEWDMTFVSSGYAALQEMEKRCFDVVIADMRMPGMDGAELLLAVKKICPKSVRIILSGQADLESIMKVLDTTHQYLSKPCDAVLLRNSIDRAAQLRKLIHSPELEEYISQLQTIPARPEMYKIVVDEFNTSSPSLEKVAAAVGADMGMAAKVLQLVNSSFFGAKREVNCPGEGVAILGVDVLRKLVLSHKIFRPAESDLIGALKLSELHRHSISIGNFAQRIALLEGLSAPLAQMCSSTGFLRDIGSIVLSSFAPDKYRLILEGNLGTKSTLEREMEIFGTTHCRVGGYLLGLWGLPNTMVNAASYHHAMEAMKEPEFSILAAIQLGEQLALTTDYGTSSHIEQLKDLSTYRQLRKSIVSGGSQGAP